MTKSERFLDFLTRIKCICYNNLFGAFLLVDCLQSTFSLKFRLVLISTSATVNHDVTLQ